MLHPSASAGSIIKRIVTINPELGVHEIALIIRSCVETQKDTTGDFMDVEIINEVKAVALAKATLSPNFKFS